MNVLRAILSLCVAFSLSASADLLSEHNEAHTAIQAAQEALKARNCAFAYPVRVQRYRVVDEPEGIRIQAKEYFLACTPAEATISVTWQAPTSREDGTPIAPGELKGYKMYVFPADSTEAVVKSTLPAAIGMTAVDSNDLESELSDLVFVRW